MVDNQKIGSYAFLLGVIIAIIAGATAAVAIGVPGVEHVPLVLVVLGLIVGFLNISDKEVQSFLVAGIALMAIGIPGSALGELNKIQVIPLGDILSTILVMISLFAAPAVLIVALKAFYKLSKTPTV